MADEFETLMLEHAKDPVKMPDKEKAELRLLYGERRSIPEITKTLGLDETEDFWRRLVLPQYKTVDPELKSLGKLKGKIRVGTGRVTGDVIEVPLYPHPSLSRERLKWETSKRTKAVVEAMATYPEAVVIALYNPRTEKNELCIERSLGRAVMKLYWFRLKRWVQNFLGKE